MGLFGRKKTVEQRTAGELDAMAAAGAIVGAALVAVRDAAKPGISTLELDQVAESVIRDAGAVPSFLGYHGFPASICSSVNDQVVHGIPSATAVLADGDLVSIDCGAILDGWHGDSAWTFAVGTVIPVDEALSEATRLSMEAGIAAMIPGNRLTDVSHAIELGTRAAEKQFDRAFGIVDGYGGHGIGRSMHLDPFLPNEGAPGKGPLLAVGSVLAIEPMLTLGTTQTRVLADDWTVVTTDGSRAAHWEHTVAVTEDGPRILTLRPSLLALDGRRALRAEDGHAGDRVVTLRPRTFGRVEVGDLDPVVLECAGGVAFQRGAAALITLLVQYGLWGHGAPGQRQQCVHLCLVRLRTRNRLGCRVEVFVAQIGHAVAYAQLGDIHIAGLGDVSGIVTLGLVVDARRDHDNRRDHPQGAEHDARDG